MLARFGSILLAALESGQGHRILLRARLHLLVSEACGKPLQDSLQREVQLFIPHVWM